MPPTLFSLSTKFPVHTRRVFFFFFSSFPFFPWFPLFAFFFVPPGPWCAFFCFLPAAHAADGVCLFFNSAPPLPEVFLFFYFGPSVSSLLFSMCWSVRVLWRRVVGSCRPARYRYTVWDMEKPTSVTTGLNFSPLR